jgi:class 3 adenylate cyclase
MSQIRRLAAILAADVAGYSRLMGADEEGTLAALKAIRRELSDPKVKEHRGRIVKTTGDGMLVEFASVESASSGNRRRSQRHGRSNSSHRSAGMTSVCVKSSPLNSSGSPVVRASAYAKQSPKFSLAGCPLPLPKSR